MLEIDKLACVRGSRLLFRHIHSQVLPGDLLRVTGSNGAGKTSLLRMLCGLLEPTAGEVRWQHEKISKVREQYARSLLYIGHAAGLKDDLTAIENLQVAETLAGRNMTADQASTALSLAGLNGRERMPARQLSQGQKNACIWRALPCHPHLHCGYSMNLLMHLMLWVVHGCRLKSAGI
jgi:heme exporter protein A